MSETAPATGIALASTSLRAVLVKVTFWSVSSKGSLVSDCGGVGDESSGPGGVVLAEVCIPGEAAIEARAPAEDWLGNPADVVEVTAL